MNSVQIKYASTGTGLPPWTGWIPLAFGLLFLISAMYYEVRLVLIGQTTSGEIARFERHGNTGYVYIRYRTQSDQDAECRQALLMREHFDVGQRVDIYYLPDQPKMGRIVSYFQLWQPLAAKLILGTAAVLTSIALFRRRFFGMSERENLSQFD